MRVTGSSGEISVMAKPATVMAESDAAAQISGNATSVITASRAQARGWGSFRGESVITARLSRATREEKRAARRCDPVQKSKKPRPKSRRGFLENEIARGS